MLLNPPYDNGIDPVIFETNLERPLTAREWELRMPQPKVQPTPEQIARSAQAMRFSTPADSYGLKGLSVKSHLLPQT